MVFDSQFHKMLTFPLCGIVLDHFRLESDPNKKILLIPGPDLACNGFIPMLWLGYKESNSILYQLRRARAGLLILSKIEL